ncbi:molybdopterin-dependent oxidoreductase [Luteolibacter luteus]|uniref:Molybdopterin-dependent oxidoreductase n=1 Tax=Luteolibacter luteus TaxID=2728835 RepID=A0A858RJX2_9BACT|nr:molybdopterin-dependent oxidoreductase [Luteolibacter luteus]QJE96804.1 molybdopterin-dependent oxidoreductase [Luteolibacter luteus]
MTSIPATATTRRDFLRLLASGTAAIAAGELLAAEDQITLPFENGVRSLASYPGKRPLILLTSRPPQLETPFSIFNEGVLTPNDAFFVRYHLSNIPLSIDTETFRLSIKGSVGTPLSLSLDDLKNNFEQVETVAVAQCSGNSRGFIQPRVGGGQLGNGAMGNARWKGVRLKDVLEKAGVKPGAKQVSFDGLDTAVMPGTPDFVKALDLGKALDGEILIAHSMNGEDLPMLNGFPIRLVVPGYYATYWVKHLSEITVLDQPFEGFWVKTAYRIPDTAGACVPPGTAPANTIPINRLNVRSFITSHPDGAVVKAGEQVSIRGIAFDGGEGIKEVQFSGDGGKTWIATTLGEDLGRFSFREWTLIHQARAKGRAEWKVRAFNRVGESQPAEALWNPAGYMRNVVETVNVEIA